jgi:hypothetical protein
LGEKLAEVVPELREKYESELRWWGEEKPGAHIIFGDVLNPFLVTLLDTIAKEKILRQIFEFLEELANHEDQRVQEVVAATVCEYLLHKKDWMTKARQYMGPQTLRLSRKVEAFWSKEKES